jgi:hypothetical protein
MATDALVRGVSPDAGVVMDVSTVGKIESLSAAYDVQTEFKLTVLLGFAPAMRNIVSSCVIKVLTYLPMPIV